MQPPLVEKEAIFQANSYNLYEVSKYPSREGQGSAATMTDLTVINTRKQRGDKWNTQYLNKASNDLKWEKQTLK